MSDVAMTVPVVYSLATQYPDLRITVLSSPYARAFFDSLAPNVGFMAADLKGEYHGMKGLNALYRRLLAKNFTAIADFHSVLRTGYLRMRFNLDRYKVAHIDKHRAGRRDLVSRHIMVQQPSAFQNYADVLAQLGYPVRLDFISLFPERGGDLRLLPPEIGMKKTFQTWIGIAPFAQYRGKAYPVELMERVMQGLMHLHPSCRVFLFGGGGEENTLMQAWENLYGCCVNASGTIGSLRGELILMSHLDLMVSMDSAYMHLASLTDTPVVSVWGATHPYAGFTGWRQDDSGIVQENISCRPCSINGRKRCFFGDYHCLSDITPEMIIDCAEKVLQDNVERM